MYHRDMFLGFFSRLSFGSIMTLEMKYMWFTMSYCSRKLWFPQFLIQSTLIIVEIFNTSFSCSEDSLMFFLICGDYCIVLTRRKTKPLLLMDKLFLVRRQSSSLFPLQYSCRTTDKILVIHERPRVRMHSAMWTQISSQL